MSRDVVLLALLAEHGQRFVNSKRHPAAGVGRGDTRIIRILVLDRTAQRVGQTQEISGDRKFSIKHNYNNYKYHGNTLIYQVNK